MQLSRELYTTLSYVLTECKSFRFRHEIAVVLQTGPFLTSSCYNFYFIKTVQKCNLNYKNLGNMIHPAHSLRSGYQIALNVRASCTLDGEVGYDSSDSSDCQQGRSAVSLVRIIAVQSSLDLTVFNFTIILNLAIFPCCNRM